MGTTVPGYVGQRHARRRQPTHRRWLRPMGMVALSVVLVVLGAAALFGIVLLVAPLF